MTVIFQAPGARPFDASDFRSQFQKVFIVVRATKSPSDEHEYTVATVRQTDVPAFGPALPADGHFSAAAIADGSFHRFLMAKIINAENACYLCGHLQKLSTRTRSLLLDNIVNTYGSDVPVTGAKVKTSIVQRVTGRSNGSKRRHRVSDANRLSVDLDVGWFGHGALSWFVQVDGPGSAGAIINTILVVSSDQVVVVEEGTLSILHHIPAAAVLGWSALDRTLDRTGASLRLFFGRHEDSLVLHCDGQERQQIVNQLQCRTAGCHILDLDVRRDDPKQPWGFTVLGSTITEVVPGGIASLAGLGTQHQLLQINERSVRNMQQADIVQAVRMHELAVHLRVKSNSPTVYDLEASNPGKLPLLQTVRPASMGELAADTLKSEWPTLEPTQTCSESSGSLDLIVNSVLSRGTSLGSDGYRKTGVDQLEARVAELERRLAYSEHAARTLMRKNQDLKRRNLELRSRLDLFDQNYLMDDDEDSPPPSRSPSVDGLYTTTV